MTDEPANDDELSPEVTQILADESTWVPAPDLAETLVAQIGREAAPGRDTDDDSTGNVRQLRPARRSRWLAPVAAAAAILIAIAAPIYLDRGSDAEVAAIAGTALAPDASAEVAFSPTGSGWEITLNVEGLEPAPEGGFYHAWLRNADGEIISIGTFHARESGRDITLWSGVPIREYPTLTVSRELVGGGPGSSGETVLEGRLLDDDQ